MGYPACKTEKGGMDTTWSGVGNRSRGAKLKIWLRRLLRVEFQTRNLHSPARRLQSGAKIAGKSQMTLAVQQARTISQTVVRYLPVSGITGWFQWYRKQRFAPAVEQYVRDLYQVNVDGFTDIDLQMLEQDVRAVAGTLNAYVYVEALHGSRDHQHYKMLLTQLNEAADALSQGLSPSPAMRPSEEQMMQRLNAMLEAQISPSVHTGCVTASKP